jgi:hypothetical protein
MRSRIEQTSSSGDQGAIVSWKLWILVVVAVVVMVGAGMTVRALVMDVARNVRVGDVLDEHDAELRDIPGVRSLGTHSGGDEPAHIVVYVDKATAAVRAAVPATLDGYRVDVEETPTLPPSPPLLGGVVKKVTDATPAQAAAGIAGTVTIEGDLYEGGDGDSKPLPRTLVVRMPATVQIWRPQGEGKEFITFADVRAGDAVQATLTVVPAAHARSATAADLEVYPRM